MTNSDPTATEPGGPAPGLTSVAGVRVGHDVLAGRPTGCTVVLTEAGAVGAVDVRGGAPGTRETAILDPLSSVEQVHGVVLAGGSAFGLDAASGAMRLLEERGAGYQTRTIKVPIVASAILYDLWLGDPAIRPDAESGYRAASAASAGPIPEGNVGAGAGASVGKLAGFERAMKAGVGNAAFELADETGRKLVVAALAVVNAVGDVVDPATGRVVAGVREPGGGLADARRQLRTSFPPPPRGAAQNTTLAVVATNATLTRAQAAKVAQMAQDGIARAVSPAHTPYDGDTVFVLATGELERELELLSIGALAADAVAGAIVRGATQAEGLPGLPAARDLR